jgi:hypothetical protein
MVRLVLIVIVAAMLPLAAHAQEWATYINGRFGTTIEYPADLFEMLPPPENDDGRSFATADGAARFIVYAGYNVLEQTLTELADTAAAGADSVIYRQESGRWYLLQGTRGDDIFYGKVVLTDEGVIHSFEITYPAAQRETFDPIAAQMVDSMSSGRR